MACYEGKNLQILTIMVETFEFLLNSYGTSFQLIAKWNNFAGSGPEIQIFDTRKPCYKYIICCLYNSLYVSILIY